MAKFTVCVSDERHASYEVERKLLQSIDAELKLCSCESAEDIAAQCAEADAVLLDLAPMTAVAIAGLKRCKIISRYGVGFENVDLDAATAAGIQVTNVPDYCMEDVSDHALPAPRVYAGPEGPGGRVEPPGPQLPPPGKDAGRDRRGAHCPGPHPQDQRL